MNPKTDPPDSPPAEESPVSHGLSPLARRHLEDMRRHFDHASRPGGRLAAGYRRLLAHYYNLLIPASASVLEIGCGSGELLALLQTRKIAGVDISQVQIDQARQRLAHGVFSVQSGEELELEGSFDYIIVSDTLNLAADVQGLLARLHRVSRPETRLLINFYSVLWHPILSLATHVGLRASQPASSWLSTTDVENLLMLAGWQQIKCASRILLPFPLFGLDRLANRWLAPILPWLCPSVFSVARPAPRGGGSALKVSVVIPARNEAGTVESAIPRLPEMGAGTEIIFVEGNSHDDTWDVIQGLPAKFPHRKIVTLRQPGRGKGDAVRAGFAVASGDILMILDADLTVPPEDLSKFYEAIASGRGEFANGVRLVYPMEKKAMRFFNLCANKFFSAAFSWVLGQPVKDTLCGTKVLSRVHYERLVQNRSYFGDFDPFGDFDLLFGADRLGLKITDIPVRYQERIYGETNIHRWQHGLLLFRMLWLAARRLKFV